MQNAVTVYWQHAWGRHEKHHEAHCKHEGRDAEAWTKSSTVKRRHEEISYKPHAVLPRTHYFWSARRVSSLKSSTVGKYEHKLYLTSDKCVLLFYQDASLEQRTMASMQKFWGALSLAWQNLQNGLGLHYTNSSCIVWFVDIWHGVVINLQVCAKVDHDMTFLIMYRCCGSSLKRSTVQSQLW